MNEYVPVITTLPAPVPKLHWTNPPEPKAPEHTGPLESGEYRRISVWGWLAVAAEISFCALVVWAVHAVFSTPNSSDPYVGEDHSLDGLVGAITVIAIVLTFIAVVYTLINSWTVPGPRQPMSKTRMVITAVSGVYLASVVWRHRPGRPGHHWGDTSGLQNQGNQLPWMQ